MRSNRFVLLRKDVFGVLASAEGELSVSDISIAVGKKRLAASRFWSRLTDEYGLVFALFFQPPLAQVSSVLSALEQELLLVVTPSGARGVTYSLV